MNSKIADPRWQFGNNDAILTSSGGDYTDVKVTVYLWGCLTSKGYSASVLNRR